MITVSLEKAKELKENGWNRTTDFSFDSEDGKRPDRNSVHYVGDIYYPAPTAQEILDELPGDIHIIDWGGTDDTPVRYTIYLEKYKDGRYHVGYYEPKHGDVAIHTESKNLANALAYLWIYLSKNGHINAKESASY